MTYYAGRETGPGFGMVLCKNELERISGGDLKGDCFQSGEGYRCIVQYKAKRHSFGSFETVKLCNAHYDYQLKRLNKGFVPEKKRRKPVPKGYRVSANKYIPDIYYPYIMLNKKRIELESTRCKKEARAIYLKAFEKEFGPIEEK